MSLKERLKTVAEEFSNTQERREQLQLIIEYGEELQQSPRETFSEEDKVPGCVSDVYIRVKTGNEKQNTTQSEKEHGKDDDVYFEAFVASLVTKGYVAILFELLNGLPKEEILNSEKAINEFIKEAKIDVSLVPTRTNAFQRVYAFMMNKTREN